MKVSQAAESERLVNMLGERVVESIQRLLLE